MNPLLYVLFVASGALGLVYEVVWMRELALVFGASAPAVAVVLAVFMLGLALGAYALGRFITVRSMNPWRVYGTLEILVALCALALPLGLHAVEPLFAAAYASSMLGPLRFLAALVLLLPATICLGGTLPVMARALDPLRGQFSQRLAWLYAANTGGAALGAFLAPFVLIPQLGASVTLYGTPVLNVIVGALAFRLGRSYVPAPERNATVAAPARAKLDRGVLLALALVSGFVVILLEVVVTRLLAGYLGQSSYGFGLMLTCFVLGLALGAWAAGALLRVYRSDARLLAVILVLASVSLVGMVLMLGRVPWWLARGALAIHAQANPFPSFLALQFLLAFAVLLPPTFLLGMVFPILLGSAGEGARGASREIGFLYGVNTMGSVTAALLGGFVLVPAIGIHAALVLASATTALSALLVIGREMQLARAFVPVGAMLALVALATIPLAFLLGQPNERVLLRSPWLYGRTPPLYDGYVDEMARGQPEVKFLGYDAHGTVGVGVQSAIEPSYQFFTVNGKVDGGTGEDMYTQVSLGTWPCLLCDAGRRDPQDVLVIGLGTGSTVGAALSFPVRSVDIVEISPTMSRVAREFFADVNRNALDDPRARLIVGDGRHHLGYARKKYDVIVSEPSNPWISGIGFLFTRENFRLMRSALTDGGVACQWLQIYDLQAQAVKSVIKTFTSVFPVSIAMLASQAPADILLLGFNRDASADGKWLDYAVIEQAFARHQVASGYETYSPRSPDALIDRFLMGSRGMAEYASDAVINTDDNAFLEFEAPKSLATAGDPNPMLYELGAACEPVSAYLAYPPKRAAELTAAALDATLQMRFSVRFGLELSPLFASPAGAPLRIPAIVAQVAPTEFSDFARRFGETPMLHGLAGMLNEYMPVAGTDPPQLMRYGAGFQPELGRQHFRRVLELDPASVEARLALAMSYQFGEDGKRWSHGWRADEAARLYREVLDRRANDVDTKLHLINVVMRGGDLVQAEKLAYETFREHGENVEAATTYGALLQQRNKLGEARTVLEAAVQRDATNVRALRQLGAVHARLGNKAEARQLMQKALDLNPNDPDSQAMMRQVEALK